jgi:hypothetical protein
VFRRDGHFASVDSPEFTSKVPVFEKEEQTLSEIRSEVFSYDVMCLSHFFFLL